MNPYRIGLLGASWIAVPAVIEPLKQTSRAVVTAVAARNSARAEDYARTHAIPTVAGSYDALVERPDVDLVYNALTPSEHCRWTVAALEAGKHVLCEKPFAMNAEEARRMVDAARANGRHLIEAWHYRFHPLMRRVEAIVRGGLLGKLTGASARFFAPIPATPEEFRWQGRLGGGALMDTGGYTIHSLRTLLGREPAVLEAKSTRYGDVDLVTEAKLDFGNGLVADIECSMVFRDLFSELRLIGSAGTLTVHGFPLPQWGCSLKLETAAGTTAETNFPGTSYQAQMEHVIAVLDGVTPQVTGGEDAIGNIQVMDAIRAHATA